MYRELPHLCVRNAGLNMIHIFIHCRNETSGYTKQRHTERKNAMTMAHVVIYLCFFGCMHLKGVGALSAVD